MIISLRPAEVCSLANLVGDCQKNRSQGENGLPVFKMNRKPA